MIPVVVQGLENVLFLLVSVRHKCANPVSLGLQGPCHSNLVCKVVVRGEIQVAACVVYFVYTDVNRDPSSWWVTTKESYPFHSSMVNLIVGSTVLRWSRNRSTWSSGRAVNVSCRVVHVPFPEGVWVWAGAESSFLHILHDCNRHWGPHSCAEDLLENVSVVGKVGGIQAESEQVDYFIRRQAGPFS